MSVYIIYIYVHICYIHCTYREGINTCTFSQSYKPINLYTHNVAEGTPGLDTQKCPLAGGTGEEAQDPVYKRLRPLCCDERLTLQICIRVKTFSKSRTTSGEGKWDTGGRGWMPSPVGPSWVRRAAASKVKMRASEDATFPGLRRAEMSPGAPLHLRPLPLENGQDAPRLSSILRPWKLGPQPRAAWRAEGRVEARVLCWAFPQRARIKAVDTARAW